MSKIKDKEFNIFINYMIEYMYSTDKTTKVLSNEQINLITRFNTRRKDNIDKLLNVLLRINANIYNIFVDIQEYLHMSFENNVESGICYITKTKIYFPRRLILSYKIKDDMIIKKEYIIRSDFVDYFRWFYIYNHFGYYLMSSLYNQNNKIDIYSTWIQNMYNVYTYCENKIKDLTNPLLIN